MTFPGTATAISSPRGFAADLLAGDPRLDEVVLMLSEVATNAVMHTATGQGGTFLVTISSGHHGEPLRVEVHDDGADTQPQVNQSGADETHGRGVAIVEALAYRWGCEPCTHGTKVWFEAACPGGVVTQS
ncbi:ATP-binding protein [Sphaerisporangium sp. NPDC049002]|uniref:ATP-binding protein n=1 Tax=Sphaerisporangium sp. NPDC049002 TaxID=3155392 RepID=UPI0033E941DC